METLIDRIPEWRALYNAAMAADEMFHLAVVKQFGEKQAGDMRYRSSKHNAETRAAAEFKHAADIALLDMNEYYRTHREQ